ncbi:MAG: hypothetical protein QNK24_05030 [Desulfuromusa sp.]|nr:hypothetical protein [Desulfuromusa sp.]
MTIQVVYKNGKEDLVEKKFLDILLHIGEVQEFRRSDHWVNVTVDPIRSSQQCQYHGNNRRLHDGTELPPAMGI